MKKLSYSSELTKERIIACAKEEFLKKGFINANLRISLAETLRKLPLSFFGKKDLADLTSTVMGDVTMMENAFSHFIPGFIGSIISTIITGTFVSLSQNREKLQPSSARRVAVKVQP